MSKTVRKKELEVLLPTSLPPSPPKPPTLQPTPSPKFSSKKLVVSDDVLIRDEESKRRKSNDQGLVEENYYKDYVAMERQHSTLFQLHHTTLEGHFDSEKSATKAMEDVEENNKLTMDQEDEKKVTTISSTNAEFSAITNINANKTNYTTEDEKIINMSSLSKKISAQQPPRTKTLTKRRHDVYAPLIISPFSSTMPPRIPRLATVFVASSLSYSTKSLHDENVTEAKCKESRDSCGSKNGSCNSISSDSSANSNLKQGADKTASVLTGTAILIHKGLVQKSVPVISTCIDAAGRFVKENMIAESNPVIDSSCINITQKEVNESPPFHWTNIAKDALDMGGESRIKKKNEVEEENQLCNAVFGKSFETSSLQRKKEKVDGCNDEVRTALEYTGTARKWSGRAFSLSKAVASGVCDVTANALSTATKRMGEIGFYEEMVPSPEDREILEAGAKVALAGLGATAIVADSVFETTKAIAKKSADVTADVVQHKYGNDAKQIVTDTAQTLGNTVGAITQLRMLEVRAATMAIAEKAGRNASATSAACEEAGIPSEERIDDEPNDRNIRKSLATLTSSMVKTAYGQVLKVRECHHLNNNALTAGGNEHEFNFNRKDIRNHFTNFTNALKSTETI